MSVFVATINRKCLNTASTARVHFCRTLLDLKVTIWTLKGPHRFIMYCVLFWKGQFLSSACEGTILGTNQKDTNTERTQCQGYKRWRCIHNINLLSFPESESLVLLPQTHLESWFKLNKITIKDSFLLNNDCDENEVESLTFEPRHESIERADAEVLMDVICDEGT